MMVKRLLPLFALLPLAAASLLLLAACFRPPGGHYDFNLRMNELSCVRMRVNPYDVWSGKVALRPFYPNTHVGAPPDGCTEQVNAYAPWEYVYMMPFSLLPREAAWAAYCLVMALSFFLVLRLSGFSLFENSSLRATVPMLLVSYTVFSNVSVGNFGIVVLAAAVAMAWALNRGRVWLAGVCWAIAMVKPQIGLTFAIPLLMRWKWRTGSCAGAICLAASAVAAFVCRTSLADMLRQGPAANTSFFLGCGTWPKFLCGTFRGDGDILAGIVVGVVACAAMTWLVRKEKDWFVFLMPAAITSCCWTYTQVYSHAMGWFVAFVIVCELLRRPQSKGLWAMAAFAVLSLTRWPLACYGLCRFVGRPFPMSEYAFRCLDSLNSTLSLALAFALCLWLSRRPGEQ